MIKQLIIATAFGIAAVGTALAADAPKDTKDCMDQAFELAKSAQNTKLSDEKLAELDEQLATMEDHCADGDMAKAAEVKAEVEGALSQ